MNYLFNTMFFRLFFKYWRFSVILVSSALLLSCERLAAPNFEAELVEASPGQYILDKDHGVVLFKLNHYSFSTYIGSFNDINASLDWDPENIENSSLEVVINTASIDVNNPEFEGELRGSNWFDVENYPQATFRTTSFLESEGNSFKFEGDLTLMGITAPVTLSANFNGSGFVLLTRSNTIGFSASATFQRSVFGLGRFRPMVGDDIELEISVEFQENS